MLSAEHTDERPLLGRNHRQRDMKVIIILVLVVMFQITFGIRFRSTKNGFYQGSKIMFDVWDFFGQKNSTMNDSLSLSSLSSPSVSSSPKILKRAMFYNIYIPPWNPRLAQEVIEEQISTIGKSFAAASSYTVNATIYYLTLGRLLPDGYMDDLCTQKYNLTCQHLGHHLKGFEVRTLSTLYDYCQLHPEERVVYFHSKGTPSFLMYGSYVAVVERGNTAR